VGFEPELALLKAVPVARDIDGRPWYMPIEGQHVFIAGRTGAGKNSWTWSLVLNLAPVWKVGLVRFYGCDPKRCELAIARGWWDFYADTDEDMVSLLEKCVDEMQQRLREMQGVRRCFVASTETPLNVIIIDELGYLAAYMPDKKLRERADKAVRTILSQGRAPGYAVVAAVQDVRVEVCAYRNMFPLRIAGGLNEAKQVDMVLGEGMHEKAPCEQIPLGREGAGVAYVLDAERMMRPLMVRAPWCSDETIKRVLSRPARSVVHTDGLKADDLSLQPLQQWQYTVE